jgi:hypothetical protein
VRQERVTERIVSVAIFPCDPLDQDTLGTEDMGPAVATTVKPPEAKPATQGYTQGNESPFVTDDPHSLPIDPENDQEE